jgi:hypothetical protein
MNRPEQPPLTVERTIAHSFTSKQEAIMAVDPVRPEEVVRVALDVGIELFLSLAGIPTASLPRDDPDKEEQAPVYSAKTQEWLSLACFQKIGRVPVLPTLRAAQIMLAGEASERGVRAFPEAEVDEEISKNPVAAATFRLLRKGPITQFGKPLYDSLTETARDMGVKDRGWPGAAHILGRRLKALKPLFNRKGVLIAWHHTSEGTFWEIRYAEDGEVIGETTSAAVSPLNSLLGHQLGQGDATDAILLARLSEILASPGPSSPLTAEEIKRWIPRKEEEICGLTRIKQFFKDAYRAGGRTQNILVTGSSRSGKTSSIKWYVTALACADRTRPTVDPCDRCRACREAVARYGQLGWESDLHLSEIDFVPIDCPNCNSQELKAKLRVLNDSDKLKIVYLDEFHRFEERGKDERLLKAMDERQIIWIASCISTDGLDAAVLNRFGEKLTTEPATIEEAALWAAGRCRAWDIACDDPNALFYLAVRASGIPGNMLKVIGSAATRGRRLTRQLVEGFRFQAED